MLETLLNEIVLCERCSFANKEIPPIAPAVKMGNVKVMLVGENPSWEPGQRVPFDGITNSGRALHEHYLTPLMKFLDLKERDFWITDLFKCRYPKDVYRKKTELQGQIFANVKTCADHWLVREIQFAQPQVVVTLGDKEVYQRVRLIFDLANCPLKFSDAAYEPHPIEIGNQRSVLLPACHPDISFYNSRKPAPSRKWSDVHKAKFVISIQRAFALDQKGLN